MAQPFDHVNRLDPSGYIVFRWLTAEAAGSGVAVEVPVVEASIGLVDPDSTAPLDVSDARAGWELRPTTAPSMSSAIAMIRATRTSHHLGRCSRSADTLWVPFWTPRKTHASSLPERRGGNAANGGHGSARIGARAAGCRQRGIGAGALASVDVVGGRRRRGRKYAASRRMTGSGPSTARAGPSGPALGGWTEGDGPSG